MTSSDRVNVRLSDDLLGAIDELVESGEFHSRSAVVRAALRESDDVRYSDTHDIFDASAAARRRR